MLMRNSARGAGGACAGPAEGRAAARNRGGEAAGPRVRSGVAASERRMGAVGFEKRWQKRGADCSAQAAARNAPRCAFRCATAAGRRAGRQVLHVRAQLSPRQKEIRRQFRPKFRLRPRHVSAPPAETPRAAPCRRCVPPAPVPRCSCSARRRCCARARGCTVCFARMAPRGRASAPTLLRRRRGR